MRHIVIRETLIFASIGLSLELLIVLLLGFGSDTYFLVPVGVSIVGLYLAAIVLGVVFGRIIDQARLSPNKLFLGGVIIAWLSLIIQVLSGSSVEYFKNIRHVNAFLDYIFKPFFWVVFLGSIPAIAIGALYSVRIKWLYDKIEKVP